MQNVTRTAVCALLVTLPAPHMQADWEDQVVPAAGIITLGTAICYGMSCYSSYCDRRNAENVATHLCDAVHDAQQQYTNLYTAWQQSHASYEDYLRHMISTCDGTPIEDIIASLESTRARVATCLERAKSTITSKQHPELFEQVRANVSRASNLITTLDTLIAHMYQHYAHFATYDVLYGSRHLVPYYSTAVTYYTQYPDPERRDYVDQAIMSQYASTRIHWPRVYAVDRMTGHLNLLEQCHTLLHNASGCHAYPAEEELNTALIERVHHLWYHVKEIQLIETTLPAYQTERDGHYQEQRQKEYEERMQAMYQKQVDAEKDRAEAERRRAQSEEERAREMDRANDLRRKAFRWGYHRLPEIQDQIERLAEACRRGTVDREDTYRELTDILGKFPHQSSSVAEGISLLLQ